MIAIILLLLIFFHGYILAKKIINENELLTISLGFLIGSIFSISFLYYLTSITKNINLSITIFIVLSLCAIFFLKNLYLESILSLLKINKINIFFLLVLLTSSYWLFEKSFNYDSLHGNFLIASNVYMDFGAHIPFIRSFSLGTNFPGEVPFFANSGLAYYFLFDFYTGVLEHSGFRIDIAYNLLSAVFLTFLLIIMYNLGKQQFNKKVGLLSTIFFLFCGNVSFLNFFQKYGLKPLTIFSWWHNSFYFDGMPTFLDRKIIVANFWSLNTFLNQRHFIFASSYFLIFLLLWLGKEKKSKILYLTLGTSLGLFAMWHAMVFIAIFMMSIPLLILNRDIRKQLLITLFVGGLIAFPQLLLIKLHSNITITLAPGFLLEHMISIKNEIIFWFVNLGIGLFLIPLGYFLSDRKQKNLFIILLPLFILPNIFHFSSRFPFDDHKYFNLWITCMNMFSAFVIMKLLSKDIYLKLAGLTFIILLTLSGIINIMVIKNDIYAQITDYSKNRFLQNATKIIPNNAIALTNGEIYDPITLVGKKTYIGRVQYIYVYGGDPDARILSQKDILQPDSYKHIMDVLSKNHISYLVMYKNNFAKNEKPFEESFYSKYFIKLYEDDNGIIYKI